MIEKARAHVGLRVRPEDLKRFSTKAMVASGLSERHAAATADVLVATDAWGTFTHGTRQMLPLLHNVRKGGLNADAEPTVEAEGSGWALLDGHFAMPMVTSQLAMNTAIEKARSSGIAYAGVRHSGHFGAGGYYAMMAAEKNMIGLCVCNVDVRMNIPGARSAVIGTNPLAYAVPAGSERAVFMDIATSVVAISKVLTAKVAGTAIPNNWLVDERGVPTTDPREYPEKGSIVPMAGHKGYGIALFIEILAGVLTGASFLSGVENWLAEDPKPADQGHAFIALNVEALMPIDRFKERMDAMINELRNSPRAEGADRIWLPGEMEWERHAEAYANGLLLPDYVLVNLFTVAEQTGLVDDLEAIFQTA
jgi:ureidoglycolate dehydrogenase (NAD+)